MRHYSISKPILKNTEGNCRVRSNVTRIMGPISLIFSCGNLSDEKYMNKNKEFNDVHNELISKSQP